MPLDPFMLEDFQCHRILYTKGINPRPTQLRQIPRRFQFLTQIARNRANVRPPAAINAYPDIRIYIGEESNVIDLDLPRFQCDILPLSCQLVRWPAPDL